MFPVNSKLSQIEATLCHFILQQEAMESFTFPDKIKMDIFKPFFGANLLPYAIFLRKGVFSHTL